MTTYVKYKKSDLDKDFVYGYISGYLTDKDGNHLVVIITRENKIVTQMLEDVYEIHKEKLGEGYLNYEYFKELRDKEELMIAINLLIEKNPHLKDYYSKWIKFIYVKCGTNL